MSITTDAIKSLIANNNYELMTALIENNVYLVVRENTPKQNKEVGEDKSTISDPERGGE